MWKNCTSPAPDARVCYAPQAAARMLALCVGCVALENGGRPLGLRQTEGARVRFHVAECLPPGPRAQRTRVSLLQDGEWQDWAFATLERAFPELRFLGSFHHHLCNAEQTFSAGDIAGYRELLRACPSDAGPFLAVLLPARPGLPQLAKLTSGAAAPLEEFVRHRCRHALVTREAVLPLAPERISVAATWPVEHLGHPGYAVAPAEIAARIDALQGRDMPWQLRRAPLALLRELQERLKAQATPYRITLARDESIRVRVADRELRLCSDLPGRARVLARGQAREEAEVSVIEFTRARLREIGHGLQPDS